MIQRTAGRIWMASAFCHPFSADATAPLVSLSDSSEVDKRLLPRFGRRIRAHTATEASKPSVCRVVAAGRTEHGGRVLRPCQRGPALWADSLRFPIKPLGLLPV